MELLFLLVERRGELVTRDEKVPASGGKMFFWIRMQKESCPSGHSVLLTHCVCFPATDAS
jgi:hypothetical protein